MLLYVGMVITISTSVFIIYIYLNIIRGKIVLQPCWFWKADVPFNNKCWIHKVLSTFICGENIPRKNSKTILFIFHRIYQIGLRQNVSELRFEPKSWEQNDGKLKQQTNRITCIRKSCNYHTTDIDPNYILHTLWSIP